MLRGRIWKDCRLSNTSPYAPKHKPGSDPSTIPQKPGGSAYTNLDIGELCGGWKGDRGLLLLPTDSYVGVGSDRAPSPVHCQQKFSRLSESLFYRMGGNDSIPFCRLEGF